MVLRAYDCGCLVRFEIALKIPSHHHTFIYDYSDDDDDDEDDDDDDDDDEDDEETDKTRFLASDSSFSRDKNSRFRPLFGAHISVSRS